MREIKFRARKVETVWTKKYTEYTEQPGEFVYGSLVDLGGTDIYIVVPNDYEEERTYAAAYKEANYVKVYRETVGQYTGIKDKVKTPIYEDDIVKQTYHTQAGNVHDGTDITFDGHHIGPVVITARGVCLKNPLHYSVDTDETNPMNAYKQIAGYRSEIIGNIHDNPELLEDTHG